MKLGWKWEKWKPKAHHKTGLIFAVETKQPIVPLMPKNWVMFPVEGVRRKIEENTSKSNSQKNRWEKDGEDGEDGHSFTAEMGEVSLQM